MSAQRRATIRADASPTIGTGHVSRCLTLALALEHRGWDVAFVAAPESRAAVAAVVSRRSALPVTTRDQRAVDLAIVDHYGLDAGWEQQQRAAAVLAVDDLADRAHACALLLDQNLRADGDARYRSLVPARCRLLVGPRYALIRDELAAHRVAPRPIAATPARALVSFGGADPTNQTERAIALLRAAAPALDVDVLLGSACPHVGRVRARFAGDARVHIFVDVLDVGALLARADLAVGAGGVSLWERACLGVPSLCLSIAANQVEVAREADRAGVARYLGAADQVSDDQLRQAIAELVGDAALRERLVRAGQALVDGRGAERVVDAIESCLAEALTLRRATRDDARLYFEWANDPVVRAHSFQKAPIPWSDHAAWFERKLGDQRASLYVAELFGEPAAQVRFDLDHGRAVVSVSIAAHARGKRLGSALLCAATARFFDEHSPSPPPVHGIVHCDNAASRRAFAGAGFVESPEHLVDGVRCVTYRLNPPSEDHG